MRTYMMQAFPTSVSFVALAEVAILNFYVPKLANTVWALATLMHELPVLSYEIALCALSCLQTHADTPWACAKLGHASQQLHRQRIDIKYSE
mmetsp:Transcript_56372/g.97984  ORF Transcript_56372/g.97984 Transcript_56372/m.97984 type:complete len:92 (-) Transcript_56372:25-300(-)